MKTQDLGQLNPESLDRLRLTNQWKLNMQNRLADIMRDCSNIDDKKSNEIDPREFMRVLETRLRSSEPQKHCKEFLVDYVLGFQDQETGNVRYQDMADDLKRFDYDRETNNGFVRATRSQASVSSGRRSIKGMCAPRDIFHGEDYMILNQQKVPQNVMEQIEKKLVKVKRHLQKQFGSKAEMDKSMGDLDTDKNGNFSVDEFKSYLINTCGDAMLDQKLTKDDLEGFMSSFVYNAQGNTKLDNISELVFTEDTEKVTRYLHNRGRPNPPPEFINQNLDKLEGSILAGAEDETEARRLRHVMREVEDRIFDGKHKMYHVFRKFDKDGDGFVSYKDFE